MTFNIINRLSCALRKFEQTIDIIFGRRFPPGALYAFDGTNFTNQQLPSNPKQFSIKDIVENSILWAVPKKRRSLEKRMGRRFGIPGYNWKPHVPKTNLAICVACGHDYELGHICAHCYERVKIETKEMQDTIKENLGLDPVEQNVVVIYKGEQVDTTDEFWKKQRIVEMPKKRPDWFSKNLLQSSTAEPSDSKVVKPSDVS